MRPSRTATRRGPLLAAGAVLVSAGVAALLAGCGKKPEPNRRIHSLQGSTMGTYYVVKVVLEGVDDSGPGTLLAHIPQLIEDRLQEVDDLMSTYRDDSELMRFNGWQDTAPFAVSPPTLEVMKAAVDLGRLSGGALDVTVGPLVEAWGFGAQDAHPTPPDEARLAELMASVGLRHLSYDEAAGTVSKTVPHLTCDLSSLAKGFAVDRVFGSLLDAGYRNFLVEIGGELRASGVNVEGTPWRLGIERPAMGRGGVQKVVEISGEALATSGDYRNYREIDGRRVSHLIDPRSGQPISHQLASVSVVGETCMRADALATALMVLGEADGMELAEREGLAALFLVREGDDFVERPSSVFAARFMQEEESGGAAAGSS